MAKPCPLIHADDLIVVSAFRYALGRMTYVTGSTSEWLLRYWDRLSPPTQALIVREIQEAAARDGLGWDCDKQAWEAGQQAERARLPSGWQYAFRKTCEHHCHVWQLGCSDCEWNAKAALRQEAPDG